MSGMCPVPRAGNLAPCDGDGRHFPQKIWEAVMGILLWIVFGLIAGALAKFLMPGKDPGGIVVTILLGIGGAVLGGMLATAAGFGGMTTFDVRSLVIAIGGAVVLLLGYRLITNRAIA